MAYDPNSPLPPDQEGLIQSLVLALQRLVPPELDSYGRSRVSVEAAVALSSNITQLAGNNISLGAGASAAGTMRVVPSNDTLAGMSAINSFAQDFAMNHLMGPIYDRMQIA